MVTPAAAGRKLGRYTVIKHLASGGMAQVLLARQAGIEGFERHVVIKVIHVERARDEGVVAMFLDEARMSASLHHNNIVQVTDIGQEAGEYFFAMEYVHGEDLRKLLNVVAKGKQQIPLEHVVSIVTAAAAALHYAHELTTPDRKPLNIVHRDVSPANILVAYDGTVKVVDFGIAKAAFRSTETQSGTLKGKISYMSPEQCMGNRVDRRSDVFALGIVLYELATVKRLFKGSSDFLTMTSIVQGNVPKASTVRTDIPPELDAIIDKALRLDPDERYQSADELRAALHQFAKTAGLRGSTTDLADYMRQVFGNRPEPWLVDDSEPEIEVSVDFDGASAGAAAVPTTGLRGMSTPPPGSLMARVKRKMAPPGGVEVTPIPPPNSRVPTPPRGEPAAKAPATTDTPAGEAAWKPTTTGTGTPMAWTSETPPEALAAEPAPRRKAPWLIAGAAALAIGGVAIIQPWKSSSSQPAASPATTTGTSEHDHGNAPASEPPTPEPPTPEPTPAEPPPPPEPEAIATESAATGSANGGSAEDEQPPENPVVGEKTAKRKVTRKKKKAATQRTDGKKAKFDPKVLFPK